ncbi:MAG: aminotransferase class IV [Planctomycetes bacterium]|nr:aminotransferase class IV [Planctomycetota bacterium]
MNAWLDGRFVPESRLPRRRAIAPFETMGARGGDVPLWDLHLARLAGTAARLGLPFAERPDLRAHAAELLRGNGHADDVLRLSLVPDAGGVHVVLTTRARSPVRVVRLLPTVVPRPDDAPPGDIKAEPRAFYDAVRQQAQDGGADDGIVVAADGAVLECALGSLWLRLDGVWTTPELDGRVLPGIARGLLLAAGARLGAGLAERTCDLADLHRATALAHGNAVHGVRPARLGDAEPAVAIVDSELGALWRAATAD